MTNTSDELKATGLLAGLAKIDITPPVGQPMGGYASRHDGDDDGSCEGIHDPLYARAMVLKDANISVAIVAMDQLYFLASDMVAEARRRYGLDHVIISSTHTHSGPIATTGGTPGWMNLLDEDPPEKLDYTGLSDDPWHAEMTGKILAIIGEAAENLFPARIGAGKGVLESEYLAHNRRHVDDNGKVTMLWANPERIPTDPIDPTVRVLRVDDASGKPRAILTNFACHAVVLGAGNRQISADYPGAMVQCIEKDMGPDCMGIFLQGAEGNVDPYHAILSGAEGFEIVQRAGADLAAEALRVARTIDTTKTKTPRLKAAANVMSFGHRTRTDKTFDISVTTVVINDDIALVSVPGEPFVEHQIDLAAKSPLEHTFMLGVANDGEGLPFILYLPTKKAAAEGGYGADSITFLEMGTGERIVDEAVESIRKLIQ